MKEHVNHIPSYNLIIKILVALLFFTFINTVTSTEQFGTLAIVLSLVYAVVKSFLVLSYYMHLKYESRFMQYMVTGVFVLFTLVIFITFIDYSFR